MHALTDGMKERFNVPQRKKGEGEGEWHAYNCKFANKHIEIKWKTKHKREHPPLQMGKTTWNQIFAMYRFNMNVVSLFEDLSRIIATLSWTEFRMSYEYSNIVEHFYVCGKNNQFNVNINNKTKTEKETQRHCNKFNLPNIMMSDSGKKHWSSAINSKLKKLEVALCNSSIHDRNGRAHPPNTADAAKYVTDSNG